MKFAIASTIARAASVTIALSLSGASTAAPDPTDEKNTVPPVLYQSPFRDYRPLGEDKLIPWKAANDEVGRIGGWRTYAKEAQDAAASVNPAAPATPAKAPPSPAKPPVMEAPAKPKPGHEGHGQHK